MLTGMPGHTAPDVAPLRTPGTKGDMNMEVICVVMQPVGVADGVSPMKFFSEAIHHFFKALLTNWSIVPHACLFRRSIVEKSGGFPEHLFVAEDQFMFLRCLLAGARVVHSAGTLELYRLDNTDKLSKSDSNRARHFIHWAQFLIEAERECARHGIPARHWFGYRRRVWQAWQDLVKYEVPEPGIKCALRDLLGGRDFDSPYFFERGFQRICQGFRARLGLGRAHPCFRCGPLDAAQARMLDSSRI